MLNIWYSMVISPILNHCDPEFIQGRSTSTCECSLGFINPPSLKRVVYRFKNVSDCQDLGEMLTFFRNVLLAMYAVGVVLSILVAIFAVKKLNSLGVCGKSGVYVVTPDEQAAAGPTPVSSNSQQPSASPSFSHRSVVATSSSNYAVASFSVASQRYIFHSLTHTLSFLLPPPSFPPPLSLSLSLALSLCSTHKHTVNFMHIYILQISHVSFPAQYSKPVPSYVRYSSC